MHLMRLQQMWCVTNVPGGSAAGGAIGGIRSAEGHRNLGAPGWDRGSHRIDPGGSSRRALRVDSFGAGASPPDAATPF